MAKYPWEIETSTPTKVTGAAVSDINLLKNIISSSQSATRGYDPKNTGLLDSLLSKAGALFNIKGSEKGVSFRSDIADIRTAMRNYISGAAVSKYEAKELEDLIPKSSDSDTIVKEKLRKLQERSMRKVENTLQTAGIDETAENYLGTKVITPPQENNKPFNLVDWIKNTSSYKTAQDIGQALGMQSADGRNAMRAQENALIMAENAKKKAATITDPEQKRRLLQVAGQTGETISGNMQNQMDKFSSDINKPYWQRGLQTGAEIASVADLATTLFGSPAVGPFANKMPKFYQVGPASQTGLIPKIANTTVTSIKSLKNIPDLIKNLGPNNKVNKLFNEGVGEATQKYIDGDKIIKHIEDAVENPAYKITDRQQLKGILELAKKEYSGTKISLDTIQKMFIEHSGGRTMSGVVRSGGDALYDRILRQGIRSEVDKIGASKIIKAVEQAAKNKDIAKQWKWLFNLPEKGGGVNIGGLASKTANAATIALLLSLLGIGGRSE